MRLSTEDLRSPIAVEVGLGLRVSGFRDGCVGFGLELIGLGGFKVCYLPLREFRISIFAL